jgi:hypothetical protein
MRSLIKLLLALFIIGQAADASATNYTLWIHGRGGDAARVGKYDDFNYWGPSATAAGVNKIAVNWDGYNSISSTNGVIRNALDCYCTGPNFCYVAVHSAGDLQIGYALAHYGGSTRYKKTPGTGSAGACSNSDGTTQTGWNIKWVRVASGASGGSDLADAGSWALSEPLVKDLVTTTSRALYDHSLTRGKTFHHYAGASGTLYSGILPGQDDEVVAYHSTGAVAGSAGGSYCNPSDWFCNDLNLGTSTNEGGSTKWSYHTVALRDDGEAYNHYAAGRWGGIIGPVRAHVATYAY